MNTRGFFFTLASLVCVCFLSCLSAQEGDSSAQPPKSAESLLEEAILWGTTGLGDARIMSNAAERGDYKQAVKAAREDLKKAIKDNKSLAVLTSLKVGLARDLLHTEDWRDASGLLSECEKACKAHAPKGSLMADVLFLKARILFKQKRFVEAEEMLDAALEACPGDPLDYFVGQEAPLLRAEIISESRSFNEALPYFEVAFDELLAEEGTLDFLLTTGTTDLRAGKNYFQPTFAAFCRSYSQAIREAQLKTDEFYDKVLLFKGWVNRCERFANLRIRASKDQAELEKEIDRFAKLIIKKLETESAKQNLSESVKDLENKLAEMEGDLKQRAASILNKMDPYGVWRRRIGSKELSSSLNRNEVFLDFVSFDVGKSYELLAVVSQRNQPPQCVYLGKTDELAVQILAWSEGRGESSIARRAALQIRKQIWEPLQPYVHQKEKVIICPDGIVGLVSFCALPSMKPGQFLVHEHQFSYQSSGGEFARLRMLPNEEADTSHWCLLGNPTFGYFRGRDGRRFPGLPSTQGEIELIAKRLKKKKAQAIIRQLTGIDATVEAFSIEAPRATHLHIATHGIDNTPSRLKAENRIEASSQWSLKAKTYMGLLFAESKDTESKPMLNATQISDFNLQKTRLVVLSGCGTETEFGNATKGLRACKERFKLRGLRRLLQACGPCPTNLQRN